MRNRQYLELAAVTAAVFAAAASPAFAYVGPGAGLTLVGSLVAVIVAGVVVVLGLVLFPLRLLMKHMRNAKAAKSAAAETSAEAG